MTLLKILPIDYNGNRLNEIGDKIVSALNPLIDSYRIEKPITLVDLLDNMNVLSSEIDLNQPYRIAIKSEDLLNFLSNYYTPILGVTPVPCIQTLLGNLRNHNFIVPLDSSTKFLILEGYSSGDSKSCFVSTYDSRFGGHDSDSHIERLSILAIHEVLHVLGIREHHKSEKMNSRGKLCPIIDGSITNGFLEDTDYFPCRDCYSSLGISEPVF